MRIFVLMSLFLIGAFVFAQEDTSNPSPITSENFLSLQSVQQIDFDKLYVPASSPAGEDRPLGARVNLGWFVYHPGRERFLILDVHRNIHTVYWDAAVTFVVEDKTLVDAVPMPQGVYAMLFISESGYEVWYDDLELYAPLRQHMSIEAENFIPQSLWVTCPDNTVAQGCHANVELSNGELSSIVSLPPLSTYPGGVNFYELGETDVAVRPYSPANDPEAVVRIGRIPLPYVVTSSLEGIVKLWDLNSDEIIYEVENGTGQPATFGDINADATHFVWRDNANTALYLLDFATGENHFVAELDGEYAQYYFLSNDASVILAVNLGGEPNVVAWDVASGEKHMLGEYRACERPQPDIARMTDDGTTLIIGCDTGLDIWQLAN